jgi:hypothetical protein
MRLRPQPLQQQGGSSRQRGPTAIARLRRCLQLVEECPQPLPLEAEVPQQEVCIVIGIRLRHRA